MSASRSRNQSGFTLAELIVATTLITIVMTAVYASFSATIRTCKQGEAHLQEFQDIRTALSTMEFEIGRAVPIADHLMCGSPDEMEFITLSPAMDVEQGEEPCLLWVKYRYERSNKSLVREEAPVQGAMPSPPQPGSSVDEGTLSLGTRHSFVLARNVRGLTLAYYWIPPIDRNPSEVPVWTDPIMMAEHHKGWGRPQGLSMQITFDDETADGGVRAFTSRMAFRGPTTVYNAARLGLVGEQVR